jgi:hypothetical protein
MAKADPLIRRDLNTQGQRYLILSAVWLAPVQPALPGASALRRKAARKCGKTVAERSWALAVQFPDFSPPAGAANFIFIAKTSKGWALYQP